MYSSRGSSAYGQQYSGQSGYGQNLGTAYGGSSIGGPDGGSQHSLASRHSSLLSGSQEADVGGYKSSAAHYGGQYGAIYGSASMTGAQQAPAMSAKVTGPSALEGRGGYTSALPDSPKFAPGEYVPSSSHAYSHKIDQLYPEKIHDYPAVERRQYGERQGAYIGRDMQSDTVSRYTDSVGFSHQQASLLRQEQLLKSQSIQSSSLDGTSRQIDYLTARSTASRHPAQDLVSYGGRMEADPRSSSMLSNSYGGQHAPSILGAVPRRNVDDLLYPQSSSNPGYGVSLPPGRDYGTGKGRHGTSVESDYYGGSHSRIDERRDDRAGYLREFELREEERRRELLREREKERERDKERERERERDRERKRERERMLERREKDRERERKCEAVIRRERTPPRVSKDRRGTSLTKDGRTLRRDSSSHETTHRRHSPVKEKRREYVCKIHASRLADTERDYLSVDKRYPRMFISPEFSKVIVNWPKENLKLSIHTPVSFEHDFLGDDVAEIKESPSTKPLAQQLVKAEPRRTIWNAKIILMSGLSKNALEELSSEKCYDERPLHVCNILRFAVLKKDRSFMAIGGPWDSADGVDPSVDDSVLVQTALRYAKDLAQIDLKNCRNWNRFLEIHYDRFGSDGFFSHREITVLFVPDLSECLPSLETWRNQWLAHKKAVAERERQLILKRERSREKKEGQKGTDSSKDSKRTEKSEKTKDHTSASVNTNEKDVKGKATAQKGDESDRNLLNKDGTGSREEAKNVEKKEQEDTVGTQTTGNVKVGKKKIIRRIVKQKVANKKADSETATAKQIEDGKNAGENNKRSEVSEQNESSADPSGVKTFVRKKVIKKVQVGKTIQEEDKGLQPEVTSEEVVDASDDKSKDNAENKSVTAVQGSSVKTAVKKKIIKRVLKRKLTGAATSEIKMEDKTVAQAGTEKENMEKEKTGAQNPRNEGQKPEVNLKSPIADKQASLPNSSKPETKTVKEDKKDAKENDGKGSSGTKVEGKADKKKVIQKDDQVGKRGKSKDAARSKDENKDKDGKDESRAKSIKDIKEKKMLEEPPKHPGLIFQMKGNKENKLRSLSLSLDSLLDYSDNDIEESTFELSLFAESFYEMLQYQMASRILTFLQKLRIKFVTKRNQKKRLREEKEQNRANKQRKTNELPVRTEAVKTEGTDHPEDQNTENKEDISDPKVNEVKLEEETDYEEDPEEDPEEDEEMDDAEDYSSDEKTQEEAKINADAEDEKVAGNDKEKAEEKSKDTKGEEAKPKSDNESSGKQDAKVESGKKEPSTVKETVIDKELLQAFRFFDRNRTGYIRVEDMRLIIHNMGKFFSHRDVKELVQSALLESNTGRDDHILYGKLVRMTNI